MNMNDLFPSKYLKADDCQQPRVLTMNAVALEAVGQNQDERAVLYFAGEKKGLILNKTNFSMIADIYGPETMDWEGKAIEVYKDRTSFAGKVVPCIRVREPQNGQRAPRPEAEDTIPWGESIPDPGEPLRGKKK